MSKFVLVPGTFYSNSPKRTWIVVLENGKEESFEHEHHALVRIEELLQKNKGFYVKSLVTIEELVTVVPRKTYES